MNEIYPYLKEFFQHKDIASIVFQFLPTACDRMTWLEEKIDLLFDNQGDDTLYKIHQLIIQDQNGNKRQNPLKSVGNARYLSILLSRIYCLVFEKKQPMNYVTNDKWTDCTKDCCKEKREKYGIVYTYPKSTWAFSTMRRENCSEMLERGIILVRKIYRLNFL
jgi:hypothetical protein